MKFSIEMTSDSDDSGQICSIAGSTWWVMWRNCPGLPYIWDKENMRIAQSRGFWVDNYRHSPHSSNIVNVRTYYQALALSYIGILQIKQYKFKINFLFLITFDTFHFLIYWNEHSNHNKSYLRFIETHSINVLQGPLRKFSY